MKRHRGTVLWLMALILVAALDFALLRDPYFNRPYILAVLGLEYGLFRMVSRPNERAYWVGFELLGWTYAVIDYRYFPEIRHGIVEVCQHPFLIPIVQSLLFASRISDPMFYSFLALGFDYAMTFLLAIASGRLAARWSRKRRGHSNGPEVGF